MKIFFLGILFIYFSTASAVAAEKTIGTALVKQAIRLYNAKQFSASLEKLDKSHDETKTNQGVKNIWNYYYGMNLVRLDREDEALEYFHKIVESDRLNDLSKAYYQIGLVHFNKADYRSSATNFELAMDVSSDPKLDNKLEALIEKSLAYQSYYENSKSVNLAFLLGYTYDSNILNLTPGSFQIDLPGHVFNYGGIGSVKVFNDYDRVVEPMIAVLDSYTLTDRFKSDSTLQSADALQVLISMPYKSKNTFFDMPTSYEISANYLSVYLTDTSSSRSLALTSTYAKLVAFFAVNRRYTSKYVFALGIDRSQSAFVSDDDNFDSTKFDIQTSHYYALSDRNDVSVLADIAYANNAAVGKNATYDKVSCAAGLEAPTYKGSTTSVKFNLSTLQYNQMPNVRRDNQSGVTVYSSKNLSESSNIGVSIAYVNNQSSHELNKYSDISAALQYNYSIGF